jgi:TRAP-type C4-dicarboxylate transport system permease small subunit
MHFVRKLIDRSIEGFACIMLASMLFVSSWQIVSRYFLAHPITFSEEFLRFSLIWLALIGIAYVNGKSEHITLDLGQNISLSTQRMLARFSHLMLIIFAITIMIDGGCRAVALAANQTSPELGISMAWVYLALPVSGVLCVIYSTFNLFGICEECREHVPTPLQKRTGDNHAV